MRILLSAFLLLALATNAVAQDEPINIHSYYITELTTTSFPSPNGVDLPDGAMIPAAQSVTCRLNTQWVQQHTGKQVIGISWHYTTITDPGQDPQTVYFGAGLEEQPLFCAYAAQVIIYASVLFDDYTGTQYSRAHFWVGVSRAYWDPSTLAICGQSILQGSPFPATVKLDTEFGYDKSQPGNSYYYEYTAKITWTNIAGNHREDTYSGSVSNYGPFLSFLIPFPDYDGYFDSLPNNKDSAFRAFTLDIDIRTPLNSPDPQFHERFHATLTGQLFKNWTASYYVVLDTE